MRLKFIYRLFLFTCALTNFSCTTVKHSSQTRADISRLNFIAVYEIPFDLQFRNTTVGGLSGIDYDIKNNEFYIMSDDRSDKNPARFYRAKILLNEKEIDTVIFTDVIYMLQANGKVYPNNKTDRFHTPDPEAIRYNPNTRKILWSSEGERIVTLKDTVLEDPAVNIISTSGKYVEEIILPHNLAMQATENGPRKNSVLEGMTYADDYKTLFVNVEEPLYDDGPVADVKNSAAFIRIYKFDVATEKNIAQFAYKLEQVAYKPVPETAFKINGVPDILWLGDNKLLVIERSFSTGRLPCTIKLFIADLNSATNISQVTLKNNTNFIAASKKLLLNMDELGIYTDNIEGVTFGPQLPNGHKTLLFIADNNFSRLEKTQVMLFEILE